jgi:predicted RNA-binding Zn-ribbon protein involved in translation (DUF1610 family)
VIVRCGRCSTEIQVAGPGRFECPTCGAVNEVRGAAPPGGPGAPPPGGTGAPPPGGPVVPPSEPPPVTQTSPRVTCGECDFRFIVGDVEVAPCPNCGASVEIGREEG